VRVQVLYFDDCPHYLPAVKLVSETLRSEGIDARVERVRVATAEQAQAIEFLGSPTVRINELDVEPEARMQKGYGFGCRTYPDGGKRSGLPSRQMIVHAIEEAAGNSSHIDAGQKQEVCVSQDCCGTKHASAALSLDSSEKVSGSGALLAGGLSAILASSCCLGPLVLVSLGFSGAWIGNLTRLEPYRPYFLLGAVIALIFAARRIFRSSTVCKPGEVCALPQTRHLYNLMFGITVLLVLVAFTFPYVARFFY
jgi:mercuric ion transport protein